MTGAVSQGIDLLSQEAVQDPHGFYGRLREEDPVHWNEKHRSWVLTRFDDVADTFTDPRFVSDRVQPVFDTKLSEEDRDRRAPTFSVLADWMVFKDPPDHTRLRNLVKATFTPRAIRRLAPRIEDIVSHILDGLPGSGELDVVRDFAYPVPAMVIAEMLGVPASDRDKFKEWSDAVSVLVFGGAKDAQDRVDAQEGLVGLRDYLRYLVRQKNDHPEDDLMTELLRAHLDDDALSEDEVVHTSILLLFGGHETTTNLIANSFLALMKNPEQREVLRDDSEDPVRAIEELNRFDGPSRMVVRRAGTDIELRGSTIREGDRVLLCQSAANRDSRYFADPDRLDLRRDANRHVSFGFGIHYCLGAALARLEARTALVGLIEKVKDPQLVDPELDWLPLVVVRGLHSLRVSYSG